MVSLADEITDQIFGKSRARQDGTERNLACKLYPINKYFNWDEEEDVSGGVRILEELEPDLDELGRNFDSDNEGRYSHWVDAMKAEKARLSGRPVVALCGKVWRPKHNAEEYPICPKCQEIYEKIAKNSFS